MLKVPHMKKQTEQTFKEKVKKRTQVSRDNNRLIWEMHKRPVKEVKNFYNEDRLSGREDSN